MVPSAIQLLAQPLLALPGKSDDAAQYERILRGVSKLSLPKDQCCWYYRDKRRCPTDATTGLYFEKHNRSKYCHGWTELNDEKGNYLQCQRQGTEVISRSKRIDGPCRAFAVKCNTGGHFCRPEHDTTESQRMKFTADEEEFRLIVVLPDRCCRRYNRRSVHWTPNWRRSPPRAQCRVPDLQHIPRRRCWWRRMLGSCERVVAQQSC